MIETKLSYDSWKRWSKQYLLEQKFPRGSTSSREVRPTPPRGRRPNKRGRSSQTLVGAGTHRGVAAK